MSTENEERLRLVHSSWVDFERTRREFESLENPRRKLELLPKMIGCLEATLQAMPGDRNIEYLLCQCRDAERTLTRAVQPGFEGKLTNVWPVSSVD